MKLAEALIIRADANKRLLQLRERLTQSAQVQEGDTPPEDPQELLVELGQTVETFTALVKSINRTNSLTPFDDAMNLTDALAERDALAIERNTLSELIDASTGREVRARYSRSSSIKYFRTVDVAGIQKRIDQLSRRYREIDSRIQAVNWNTDLVE